MRKLAFFGFLFAMSSMSGMSGGVGINLDTDGYYYGNTYYPYYSDDYYTGPGWYYGSYYDSEPAYWGWRRSNPYWWHHNHRAWGRSGYWRRGNYYYGRRR